MSLGRQNQGGAPRVKLPRVRDSGDLTAREVRSALSTLDQPGVRRVTVPNVALTTSTQLVPHQLGRIPVGWAIIDKTAQADVWRDPAQAQTADFIPLRASASVTVTLQFW